MTEEVKRLRAELQRIALWTSTVCYEHDDKRYVDIEDVYALKRIAANAIEGRAGLLSRSGPAPMSRSGLVRKKW